MPFEIAHLEPRRFLSAKVINHTLHVIGTNESDRIIVEYVRYIPIFDSPPAFSPYYRVTINKSVSKFKASGIRHVSAEGQNGNDYISLAGTAPLPFGPVMLGNAFVPVDSLATGGL